MKLIKSIFFVVIPLIFLLSLRQVEGQDWKKIVPLLSNCEVIKELFKVEKCQYPVFEITRKEFVANIVFANDQEYSSCPRDTVIRVLASFRVLPRLRVFEPEFASFEIRSDSDIQNGKILTHKKRGILITVQNILTENVDLGEYNVTSVRIFPREGHKKCLTTKLKKW